MKRLLIFTLCVLFSACSEKSEPEVVRVEKWYELDRPLAEYRKLQPDRPILVFYTADWSVMGQAIQKRMSEPRFFDLFSDHRVLPMAADCTDPRGERFDDFNAIRPEDMMIFCFSLSRPNEDVKWFQVNGGSSDELYELIRSHLEK